MHFVSLDPCQKRVDSQPGYPVSHQNPGRDPGRRANAKGALQGKSHDPAMQVVTLQDGFHSLVLPPPPY
ncbi:UNVERIFIED_CONTAM: hypothetical protein FKN15_005006 [Acipenser sinensis]